jgi:hypothetical protein
MKPAVRLRLSIGTLLFPALALAQTAPGSDAIGSDATSSAQGGLDPNAPPPGVHVIDDTEPKTPLIPRAKDLLGSHVLVAAAVGPAWSFGHLGSAVSAGRGLGTGLGFRADAGLGLSRSVVLGAWGNFASYADGDGCGSSCSGRAFAVGPFVRYHLQQGLRFDPWFTLGGGFRQLSFVDTTGARQKFSGVEWLHLELGADYYMFSGLGIGPYGALGASSYSKRAAAAGDAAVNTELSVGLRVLFDLPGR